MFSQKLDTMMKITNTRNSTLGKALMFDPSYISRIRSGNRKVPKDRQMVSAISWFFAGTITEEKQKKLLMNIISPNKPYPNDPEEVKNLLFDWFLKDEEEDNSIATMLLKFSSNQFVPSTDYSKQTLDENKSLGGYYFGNQGKRDAVISYLELACKEKKKLNLLLYSDEDMSWLYENTSYIKKWESLIFEVIKNGGHITLVHTISRDISEMIEQIQKWLPLYMTGAVEPYFCPKLRDGVFHRTLFISSGDMAFVSNSILSNTDNTFCSLVDDAKILEILEEEFNAYLTLCKPLLYIFDMANKDSYTTISQSFLEKDSNTTLLTPLFSPYTLPSKLKEELVINNVFYQNRFSNHFKHTMDAGCGLTEICYLPPLEVHDNITNLPINISENGVTTYYTVDELIEHINHTLEVLETTNNYHLVLSRTKLDDFLITCKEDIGVFINHLSTSPIVFMINEPRVTRAFSEFLYFNMTKFENRQETIKELNNYLTELKKHK